MSKNAKRILEIVLLAVFFFLTDRIYNAFLYANWAIESIQRKKGYKDPGERKYDKDAMIIMAILIPENIRLTGPEIRRYFRDGISKEHTYKIIDLRKKINKGNKEGTKYIRSAWLRHIFEDDYS